MKSSSPVYFMGGVLGGDGGERLAARTRQCSLMPPARCRPPVWPTLSPYIHPPLPRGGASCPPLKLPWPHAPYPAPYIRHYHHPPTRQRYIIAMMIITRPRTLHWCRGRGGPSLSSINTILPRPHHPITIHCVIHASQGRIDVEGVVDFFPRFRPWPLSMVLPQAVPMHATWCIIASGEDEDR
jgi:hypothetical protein